MTSEEFKKTLWDTANKLRGSVSAAEYISDWDGDKLSDDPRWVDGIPPKGNANFGWLQHMLARLSLRGRAGTVLANDSMSSQQSGEGEIRKQMVLEDVIECMVALPGQLFLNTQIPACLWFMSRDKHAGVNGQRDRARQIVFIDARKAATGRISRTQIEFTDEDLQRVAQTYTAGGRRPLATAAPMWTSPASASRPGSRMSASTALC
jgi:type I restriction enzyme M protein